MQNSTAREPKTVLIIEHSPALAFAIGQLLKANGLQVQYAMDGQDGFQMALEYVPDAIIQTCTFSEVDHLREAKRRIEAELSHRITNHLLTSPKYIGHFLEFQAATASKWRAVSTLARRRGIPPGQIVAIGDDENDISMLRGAGLGVAMANADEPVRRAADLVTASNDDDGVARVIERILTGAV